MDSLEHDDAAFLTARATASPPACRDSEGQLLCPKSEGGGSMGVIPPVRIARRFSIELVHRGLPCRYDGVFTSAANYCSCATIDWRRSVKFA